MPTGFCLSRRLPARSRNLSSVIDVPLARKAALCDNRPIGCYCVTAWAADLTLPQPFVAEQAPQQGNLADVNELVFGGPKNGPQFGFEHRMRWNVRQLVEE